MLEVNLPSMPFDPEYGKTLSKTWEKQGFHGLKIPKGFPLILSINVTSQGNLAVVRWFNTNKVSSDTAERLKQGYLLMLDPDGKPLFMGCFNKS